MSGTYAVRVRSLTRAVELCGGPTILATQLGITELKLNNMIDGWATVPAGVFLQVVDFLMSPELTDLMKGDHKGSTREG